MMTEGRQAPFEPTVTLLSISIFNECLILLVNRIVCQMSNLGFLACQVLVLILFWGEADQTLSVDIDSERIVARYDHVQAQVEFVPLDQKRIVEVPWDDTSFVLDNIAQAVHNVDTATAWRGWRFDNPVVEAKWTNATWLNLAVWHKHLMLNGIFRLIETLAKGVPLFR